MVTAKNPRLGRSDPRVAIHLAALLLAIAASTADAARPRFNGPAPVGGPVSAARGTVGGPGKAHAGSIGGGVSPAAVKPGVFGPKTAPAPAHPGSV